MKTVAALFASLLCTWALAAAEPDLTLPFVERDGQTLSLDVYMPTDTLQTHYCVAFAYGGGFIENHQKDEYIKDFCRRLASDGYVAVAIDYRLGLKGVKFKSKMKMIEPLHDAVMMATEDMLAAVAFILKNAPEWKVNPDGIILCGSSAGAITALQTDYELCNRTPMTQCLPQEFRFAGVVSFAGAIFSDEGRCKYRVHPPAPTLLLHGTADRLVTYNKIAFFNKRFSGSSDLVTTFKENDYPFEIIRFVGEGHGVSTRFLESYDEMTWFLNKMVKEKKNYGIDKTFKDTDHKAPKWDTSKPEDLY